MIRLTFDDGFVLFMYYPEGVTFLIAVWLSHFIRLLMLFQCNLNPTGYTCVKHLPAYSSTLTLFFNVPTELQTGDTSICL